MRPLALYLSLLAVPAAMLTACAQTGDGAPLQAMDAAVQAHFTADAPGGVVLVAHKDQVIYQRALGLANTTTGALLGPETVFRIGSITKQFTAVAILQLAEQGKLGLNDTIYRYLDLPEREHPITIRHLLDHTSGIPNYTSLPSFTPELYAKDISVADMIALFAHLPLEFEPGTRWSYSNSGYILLGAIIEKVSGSTWEAYLTEHLFKPAGMTHTSASANNGQLAGEALGYHRDGDGWEPATFLSMTWPYAAGTMRSTVGDLAKWNRALFAGKLLPLHRLQEAHTDHRLADGKETKYGFGWQFLDVQGTPSVEHGGGINGFVSESLYLPLADIHVVVLTNRESGDAAALAPTLAAIAMGKPYAADIKPLDPGLAVEYVGVYVNDEGVERYITADERGLHAQRQGSSLRDLDHLGEDRFIYHGDVTTIAFHRKGGRVIGARFRGRGVDEALVRSDKPVPTATEVKPDPALLPKYAGKYELSIGMVLTFRAEGDRFFGQGQGQTEFELFGEGPHKFFLKAIDARVVFHPEADGSVRRMTLYQGEAIEGVRVE